MTTRLKIVLRFATCAVPLALAVGCAPQGGSALAPVVPGAASAPSPAIQSSSWQAAAKKTAAWLQFGYDSGHTAYDPLETTLDKGNVSKLKVAWDDQSIVQPTGIAVDKGTVYVADGSQSPGSLYALDAASGAQLWVADVALGNVNLLQVPAVSGNIVLSPCSQGSGSTLRSGLCGLNAKSGKQIWATLCTPYQSNKTCAGVFYRGTSPTVYNGRAYFQMINAVNEEPDIDAVNPQTGKILWDVGGSYLYHCPDAGGPLTPLPANAGQVYGVLSCYTPAGSTQNGTYVCAMSATSGAIAWCTASQSAYVPRLVEGEGMVFAAETIGSNNGIVAMNEKTGAIVWTQGSAGYNIDAIAVANGRVFVNNGTTLYALSAKTGKMVWIQTQGGIEAGGDISIANGIVYTNSFGGNNGDEAITALDESNGKLIWDSSSIAGNGSSEATSAILNGTVYAACYKMCAFKLSSKPTR